MKVVVLGGNAAGMSCAARLKRKMPSAEVIVFEKTEEVSYGACGLPHYIAGETETLDMMRARSPEEFREGGVVLNLNCEVVGFDADKKSVEIKNNKTGEVFCESYDKLVISTGSSPKSPPFEGADCAYTLKTLEDGDMIKNAAAKAKKAVVIGAGYIGMEVAEGLKIAGLDVTVIEFNPRVLSAGFDEEFSKAAGEALIENGVDLRLSERVIKIEPTAVTTDKGVYPCDFTVLAAGVSANTEAFAGKIDMLKNGAIIVNDKMESSLADVYSAGDCATVIHKILKKPMFLPLGTNANKQGRMIADILSGKDLRLPPALGSTMLRVFDLEIARAGLSLAEAEAAGLNAAAVTVEAGSHAGYYPGSVPLTIKVTYNKETKVIIGAQMMGKGECALRMHVFSVAIDREMTAEELTYCDLGYAPPFAGVWDAVQQATGVIK